MEAALASFVTQTIAFADTYGLADEDALRSLLRMRMQPNFPNPLSPEHQAVLSVPCGSCSNLPPPMAGWMSR